MKSFRFLCFCFSWTVVWLSIPNGLYAQKGSAFRQTAQAVLGKSAIAAAALPQVLPKIETAARTAIGIKPVFRTPKDIRFSIAKLQSAALIALPEKNQPSATAFVFKTRYNGREEIWAVTAGHIAKGMGDRFNLIFYGNNKRIVVPGHAVQYGPNMLSDIALIQLPSDLPPEIIPLPLAQAPACPGEAFISAGYSGNRFVYTGVQNLQKDNMRFLRTSFHVSTGSRAGLCGAPLLNAAGEAVGIHCGSVWNKETGYATSVALLPYLLHAQHEGTAELPIVANGKILGNIKTTEHIHSLEGLDEQGNAISFYQTENRLPQSTITSFLNFPKTRFLRFLVEDRKNKPLEFDMHHPFRYLIYDIQTGNSFEKTVNW